MPKPLGLTLRDEQNRMKKTGEINFQGLKIEFRVMPVVELEALHEQLLESSKSLRAERTRDSRKRNSQMFLSRLRLTQAKVIRAEIRTKQEVQL